MPLQDESRTSPLKNLSHMRQAFDWVLNSFELF